MRELGYRTVDALVDWLGDDSQPLLRRVAPAEIAARLAEAPTEAGEPFEEVLEGLFRNVLPYASRTGHPRYFAFVPSAGTWPGALGDFVASACNVYAGSWLESAGPTQLELTVLGWFKDWVGYPPEAAGSLVTGGSAANLTALACARETLVGSMRDDLVIYVSDQAHSSLARAARTLGFRPDQVRVLPVGEDLRLKPATLAAAIAADEAGGRRPFLAVANAGATSAGAIDPLEELASVCREHGVWLHVDAAYGGFAVLTDRGRAALAGIALADSITLDPHKWLYQPYECGCLLVRDGRALRHAFEISSDYLRDADADVPRGQLRRSRPAAHPHDAGVQAVALAADVRARRVPGLDRPLPRSRRARGRDESRRARCSSRRHRSRSASSAFAGVRGRARTTSG